MYIKRVSENLDDKVKLAVKSVKHDLVNTPFLESNFNNGKISSVDDRIDLAFVSILEDMRNDSRVGVVYRVGGFDRENSLIRGSLDSFNTEYFPVPLSKAILYEETGLKWYRKDGYPTVGLDYNDKKISHRITSRGLFLSQRTFFSYPIQQSELDGFNSLDTDMRFFSSHLRSKYNNFVVSNKVASRDDLRHFSFGGSKLRGCKYDSSDARYMKDCKNCVFSLNKRTYVEGDRLAKGSGWKFRKTKYHRRDVYKSMPDFKEFPCDYLFAIRRYNGGGINSFHYLMQVLEHLRDKV